MTKDPSYGPQLYIIKNLPTPDGLQCRHEAGNHGQYSTRGSNSIRICLKRHFPHPSRTEHNDIKLRIRSINRPYNKVIFIHLYIIYTVLEVGVLVGSSLELYLLVFKDILFQYSIISTRKGDEQ